MSRFFAKYRKHPFKNTQARLNVETLENRLVPTANTISGFVFFDANHNGLFDAGEAPIANSQIELRTLNDVVVGSTTTDANGYYEFTKDQSVPKLDKTLTKTVTFGPTQTNFDLQKTLAQFDPSLGQLQSIEVHHAGSITSEIKVENFSQDSESDISGTVSGTLTLIAPGVNDILNLTGQAGSFHAARYDGNTDFAGTSGKSFGEHTATGDQSITLTGSAINAYIGTGTVNVTENGVATSNAGGGGNLDARIRSTGTSTVTVIYHYKEFGPLEPGSYKVVQTVQPPGFNDGLESKMGTVIPNTIGTDFIIVGLLDQDLPNNNFGELKTTQISGHVWYDANNDGIRQDTEELIPGTTITLQTPAGPMQTTTDANGFYAFTNLAPGTYTVKETQPIGYLDGKDNEGTLGGIVVNNAAEDQIQSITLQVGDDSQNNDFGELKPASLAGHVYFDANNNGLFEPGELPISGATVTLTGTNDLGAVSIPTTTNGAGAYQFDNLRPGNYVITETQPPTYADGKDTIGTPGGTTGNDVFSAITLDAGVDGVNNDFGEVRSVTPPPDTPLPRSADLQAILPFFTKNQRLWYPTLNNVDPVLVAKMTFSVGAAKTLTGQQLNLAGTYNLVQQLDAGATRQAIVNQLWASDAHRALQAGALYQEILGRAPTPQERADAIASLKTGATEVSVMETLYVSPEYQQLHPTSQALALGLYRDILNTVPGAQSLDALLQSMDNQPLQDVVHTLLVSDTSLANLIDRAYVQTVRRSASAAEIQTWTPQLKAGTMSIDDLAQRLLASQEFYQLAYNRIH